MTDEEKELARLQKAAWDIIDGKDPLPNTVLLAKGVEAVYELIRRSGLARLRCGRCKKPMLERATLERTRAINCIDCGEPERVEE